MAMSYYRAKQSGKKRTFFDILLSGGIGCGKTSLLKRYKEDTFSEEYIPTIRLGRAQVKKKVDGYDNPVRLILCDCDGQRHYEAHSFNYYQSMDAVIIVFDMSNEESMNCVLEIIALTGRTENSCIVLVGTKSDKERAINTAEAEDFAKKHDMMFYETSAKTGENIDKMFTEVIHKLIALYGEQEPPAEPKTANEKQTTGGSDVTVVDNNGCSCAIS